MFWGQAAWGLVQLSFKYIQGQKLHNHIISSIHGPVDRAVEWDLNPFLVVLNNLLQIFYVTFSFSPCKTSRIIQICMMFFEMQLIAL